MASTTSRTVTASARVLVLSDGGDNASRVTRDEAVRKAQASNAVIYSIALVEPRSRDANPRLLIARGGLRDHQAWSSKGSAPFKARRRSLKPAGSDEVAQWPGRAHNLRRPVVVATILGPAPRTDFPSSWSRYWDLEILRP